MTAPLERRIAKLQSILEVAKAMAAVRDLDPLLDLITAEARAVVEADRCSLFIRDRERDELWSKVAHGTGQIRIPGKAGIAGAVATTAQPIRIDDAYADSRFAREVDQATGYHTRSILCVPMISTKREVVGVLQALNRKEGTFTAEDEELLIALGGQAAGAIENAQLHEEIERLFEGFVRASVVAIEARDPTTAGHSERVADYTLRLARATQAAPPPGLSDIPSRPDELRQLRYAALLHDFGKVGVREHVLVKADKLYPHERDLLESRFRLIRARLELERAEARAAGRPTDAAERRLEELAGYWQLVLDCNRPTVLDEDRSAHLRRLAGLTWRDVDGDRPYVTPGELHLLSIPRGSLSEEERKEIESHVSHTYEFLRQIPWTRSLREVPTIAYAHHEKLNGRGYPRGVKALDIPSGARMMTIADIYDALTASDRPYKRAVPPEKALDILAQEAKGGQVDAALLEIFVGSGSWKLAGR